MQLSDFILEFALLFVNLVSYAGAVGIRQNKGGDISAPLEAMVAVSWGLSSLFLVAIFMLSVATCLMAKSFDAYLFVRFFCLGVSISTFLWMLHSAPNATSPEGAPQSPVM